MTEPKTLMVVSAEAGPDLRREAGQGLRPVPEYLELEREYGWEVLDWHRMGETGGGRSARRSMRQARRALSELGAHDAVLTDGEPVGLPLALAQRLARHPTPHVMIAHNLGRALKRPFFWAGAGRSLSRVVVHSRHQVRVARELGLAADRVVVIPYHVDTRFWVPPSGVREENLVVAVGREHRDYRTLASASAGLAARFFVTRSSAHSGGATCADPDRWPPSFELGRLEYPELRALYARAAVVVVPLLAVDFPAGITALLEAMAMGKAIVVTATAGLEDTVEDGVTARLVPPGDAAAMARCLSELLADAGRRRELGEAARRRALAVHALPRFASLLREQVAAAAGDRPRAIGWRRA